MCWSFCPGRFPGQVPFSPLGGHLYVFPDVCCSADASELHNDGLSVHGVQLHWADIQQKPIKSYEQYQRKGGNKREYWHQRLQLIFVLLVYQNLVHLFSFKRSGTYVWRVTSEARFWRRSFTRFLSLLWLEDTCPENSAPREWWSSSFSSWPAPLLSHLLCWPLTLILPLVSAVCLGYRLWVDFRHNVMLKAKMKLNNWYSVMNYTHFMKSFFL